MEPLTMDETDLIERQAEAGSPDDPWPAETVLRLIATIDRLVREKAKANLALSHASD
jgi:hypothetical protein